MSATKPTIAEQIAALDAERAALIAKRAPVDTRLRKIHDRRQVLVEQQAATIDPNEIGGLEALWRMAWNSGLGSRTAGNRLNQFFRSFAPEIAGCKWHSTGKRADEVFPAPQVTLVRGQDVRALAVGLLALVRKLAVNQGSVYVAVFDHGLSQYAIYGIDVDVASGAAVLHSTSYGRRTDMLKGSLEDVLARTARDHWYDREPGASDDEDGNDR